MLTLQQRRAVDWVRAKVEGRPTWRKPDYVTSSEVDVDNWVRTGLHTPPEFALIYGTARWREILKKGR